MKKISKKLSYILRHNPASIGLALDDKGYLKTKDILKHFKISLEDLDLLVETDDKKRFGFNKDKSLIRANQGHSIQANIDYEVVIPETNLFHGTSVDSLDIILKDGIKKMKRTHVHLSPDLETAKKVGSRKGKYVILTIDTKDMIKDGYTFLKSENGVYLIDFIPSKYIIKEFIYDDGN